uniref:protein artemis-like isoform X2 n=1 Tax=Styela clava TaxID=7725 RepID=UPI001939EF3D|nr:protein artemis-like isoform X2 [Styela clava]
MSCFGGLLNEYKYLSIDRFDGENLSSWAYFLSHCHTDHMVGLGDESFHEHLKSNESVFLYCSEVSRALLLADDRYYHLANNIIALPINYPKVIDIKINGNDLKSITITLLPASHCPGSVMFLFEGEEGNVLYTGDFRFSKGSGHRMKCLHTSNGTKKHIKSMYADTTFCIPDAIFIPSREDCLKRLELVVAEWLTKDDLHAVRLNISAKYGYEYLFHALHNKFKTKIYCKRKNLYQCLPETHKILTDNPEHAKIFACFKKERINKPQQWNMKEADEEDLEKKTRKKFLTLTLSTLYFTYSAKPHEVCHQVGKNHFRFCFSFHSSNSEFKSFGNLKKSEFTMNKLSTSSQIKPRKRALSLSSTDDDSQELWKEFAKNYSKKITTESNNEEQSYSDAQINNNDDFNISCSPEGKVPLSNEIDDLHLKIALNSGLPP